MDTISQENPFAVNSMALDGTHHLICYNNSLKSFKERWIEVQQSKIKFLEYNEDPRNCSNLNESIAASWIRSLDSGVSPYTKIIGRRLDYERFAEIMEQNRNLIETTQSLFDSLRVKELAAVSKYALYLFEKNGILLLHEGDKLRIVPEHASMAGIIWDEKTMGTCAHILSMELKAPVHLLGPEHYCVTFNNSSVSAAPILDESGEVIAVLVLSQHLNNPLLEDSGLSLAPYTLGLVIAMASAIENKLKLKKTYDFLKYTNDRLCVANFTQKGTMAFIEDGLISIDRTGKIVHLNKKAARIFQLDYEQMQNRYIRDFLSSDAHLLELMTSGENGDMEESLGAGQEKQAYVINIRPVVNQKTKQVEGAVLRLTNAEKLTSAANSKPGAVAAYCFEDLIGESTALKKAIGLGQRFAASLENILLTGESGTGKELFAQAIHNKYRPQGPFMAVNCAAMPKELIASELFGYEGGSFTGAERNGRAGKIELAHGGTLFLDEIGDMPLELQAVLLRVLEDKQVMRVGGRRYKKVDFRVIAATNKDLDKMVEENLFREDLYYRLAILTIKLPPLRERGNDAELLARYFIRKYCQRQGRKGMDLSPGALKRIGACPWPGNVRQLENAIIFAVNTAPGNSIEAEDLPANVSGRSPAKAEARGKLQDVYTIETMEKVLIENALYKTRYNITKAAELLEIGKSTLYRKLKDYGLETGE